MGSVLILTLIGVICSAHLGSAVTIPLAQTINSSPIDPMLTNITTVGAHIDSRFSITTTFLDTAIDENDCLMNVIIAMASLSAKIFTRPIEPPTYRDDRHPSVIILARSPPGGGLIEVRFLLWGLYLGIRSMLQEKDWRIAEFTLSWEGAIVGYLSFGQFGAQHSLQESNNSSYSTDFLTQKKSTESSNTSAISGHINTITQIASPNPAFYIEVDPTSFGASLPKINIFMAVLECLVYLAPRESDEVLLAFGVIPSPYDVALRLRPIFRTEEPFFDYGIAALGLPTIPSKLISERHQQWTEVAFNYKVNDVLVGKGDIVRARR